MSCDLPYMRLWVDDLLADLQEMGLTDEEFGAYMKLLLVAWKKGHVYAEVESNARYTSASPSRLGKLWPAFAEKWATDGNGGLVNPRQERERDEAIAKSAKAKAAAKARWNK